MMLFPDRILSKALFFLFLAGGVARAQNPDEAMSDLRVALDYYDDGKLKTELFATRALVRPEGGIQATGLVFRCFTQSGETELTIKADNCECDQADQTARSDSKVSMEKAEMKITGTGFVWNGKGERVKLLKNVRVELLRAVVPRERIVDRE